MQKQFHDMGPYIKFRGTRPPLMSSNTALSQWRHMYNKGKQFENQFFIYEPKCKKHVYFGLFRGP